MYQWVRDWRLRPTTLFIYALSITILAFTHTGVSLYLIALLNAILGFTFSVKKPYLLKLFSIFILLTVWSVFFSSLISANYGEIVLTIGSLGIRSGVINAVINVTARLAAIMGSTLLFLSLTDPYIVIKCLENDLKLPKTIVFPLAYGLRLLPLMKRDLDEINLCRIQRGYGRYPLSPQSLSSILKPLIAISLERAVWTGISIELRGFRYRKPWRFQFKLKFLDYTLYSLLVIQALLPFIIH